MPNEPQTLDPFTEWLNFMFKCMNINFKNGTSLLWNLWIVCGKMINSSLESTVCKTPRIIKHSGRYSNFRPIMIKTCDQGCGVGVGGVACFQVDSESVF